MTSTVERPAGPPGPTATPRVLPGEWAALSLLPDAGRMATEAELAQAGAAAGRPPIQYLDKMLKRLRRRGWAVCNRHVDPHSWARTPTGTGALRAAIHVRLADPSPHTGPEGQPQ